MENQRQSLSLKELLSNLDSILGKNQNNLDKSLKRLRDDIVIQIKTLYPEVKFQLSNYKKIRKNISLEDSDKFNETQNKMKTGISEILYKYFISLSDEFVKELEKIIDSYETVKDKKLGHITVERYLETLKQQKGDFKKVVSKFISDPNDVLPTMDRILEELTANSEYVHVDKGEGKTGRVDIDKITYVLRSRMNAYNNFNNFSKEIVSEEENYNFLFGESFKEFYEKIEELFSSHIKGGISKNEEILKSYVDILKKLYNKEKREDLKKLISNKEALDEYVDGKEDIVFMNVRSVYLEDFAQKAEVEFNKKRDSDPEFKVILEAINSANEKATVDGAYNEYDAEDYLREERRNKAKRKDYRKWLTLEKIENGEIWKDEVPKGIGGEIEKMLKVINPNYFTPEG